MTSVMDVIYNLLRFLGLLGEQPPLRKNFKRNRVYDDFSSDDETPMVGCTQVKRFRCSDIIHINDNDDKDSEHSNSVRNVPVPVDGSYTTSTPRKSPRRTVPLDLGSSRDGSTKPLKKTTNLNPVIDAEVYMNQKQPRLWSKRQKKPSIVNVCVVALEKDDSDDDQEDNDVLFVKEVNTLPASPHKHSSAEGNHAESLNNEVVPKTLEELKPDEKLDYKNLLWGIAKTNIRKPTSKRKPDRDGKLPDATSPQKIQVNKLNKIKLNSQLNAGRQQNTPKENDPVRVSSSDSSDSDVEEVPPELSSMSSVKKDLEKKSRNWLQEIDSQYNKVQTTVDENVARSPRAEQTETSEVLSPKLGSKFNIKLSHSKPETPQRLETVDESPRTSDPTPKENSERDEARSFSPDSIDDWLAELNEKYFSTPKPSNVKPNRGQSSKPHVTEDWLLELELNDTVQQPEVVSKEHPQLDSSREWLASLEAKYSASPQKSQENLTNTGHVFNIVPEMNDERKYVSTVESKYEKFLQKTQDQVDSTIESHIPKNNSATKEARSYLPTDAQDWLSKLDAEYNTASKTHKGLNKSWQTLKNASKVNVKPIEHDLVKPNNADDWLGELQSRYNEDQHMEQQEPNTTQESETVPTVNSEKGEDQSHILETARQKLSKLDSKTEQSNSQIVRDDTYQEENLSNANNGRSEVRSFKFNTSEDLMMKLGFLYKNYQQEANEKNNNSEQKHERTTSKSEDSIIELQSNEDFEFPALTPQQEELIESGLEPEPEDELLVEKFNMRIHRRDLQTLADENWLNDEVINFYMNLIMQRSEERKDLPKVYAMNTFFYSKLVKSGQAGLRRWTRKVDIFAYDLFLVPINVGRHWCLCLIDFRARDIYYLDSQGMPNKECLKALMQYLKDEHQDKKGAPFDNRGWYADCPTDIPQQMNGSDCGMFACTFAEFSSRDAAYSFTQAHMPYLRRKAALEILSGKLLL